jgi:hypothetical protein
MASDRYDPDERFSLDMDPEDALGAILEGAGAEDVEPEEGTEEPEAES